MLAAYWTEIDEIIFHKQNNDHQNDIHEAKMIVGTLKTQQQVEETIDVLFDSKFRMGKV